MEERESKRENEKERTIRNFLNMPPWKALLNMGTMTTRTIVSNLKVTIVETHGATWKYAHKG